MSIIPPWEKIAETKKCRISWQEFFVTDKDLEFYDKISPVFGGKKYLIPSPTTAPYERMIQKFAWRNERNFYHRKCDLTGKEILSMYHPDLPYTVYWPDAWWSDDWSFADHTRKPDWEKPFFDQMKDLMGEAPLLSLSVLHLENSEYNNCASKLKNCYLCFDVDYLEDCYYIGNSMQSKSCFDGELISHSEYCYECYNCQKCHSLLYCTDCENCQNLAFCHGCTGCSNCLFCFNQTRKEYCINNTQYTKEEYEKRRGEILSKQGYPEMLAYFQKKRKEFPVKYMHGTNNDSCNGDYIYHSRNAYNSFEGDNLEDCKNTFYLFNCKNCQDYLIYGDNSSFVYQSLATWLNVNTCAFCSMCWDNSQDVYYSLNVISSKNCFGCVGMKKGKNCFLNKAYSQKEYEDIAAKMVSHMQSTGEWWEFFPMQHSPYGFDETVAVDYTPLSNAEITRRWGKISQYDTLKGETWYTPKSITDYDEKIVGYDTAQKNIDEILVSTIICTESKRPFRLQKRELAFYIENSLPIPHIHPQVRHINRLEKYRAGTILYERKCAATGEDIITPYAPTRPEKVLSESAYQKEVY